MVDAPAEGSHGLDVAEGGVAHREPGLRQHLAANVG